MFFLYKSHVWLNNQEETEMSTAIGAQSGCEHSTKKLRTITFKNEAYKEFYQHYLQKM